MNDILCEIQNRQKLFAQLPFFKFLEKGTRIEDASIFVSGLSFFVLSFQDMLRINEIKVTDPKLLPIVQHHRKEDSGHENWYLYDLKQLGATCDESLLFGAQYSVSRDASLEMISEIFRASDDRIRLVIPLVLEAAGHIFFSRVHHFFDQIGYQKRLKYFSKEHFQIELDHELFDEDINNRLQSVELTEELRREAIEVIDRMFVAFTRMFCDLHAQIRKNHVKDLQHEFQERVKKTLVEDSEREIQLV